MAATLHRRSADLPSFAKIRDQVLDTVIASVILRYEYPIMPVS
jgi:hypothetical protein